MTANARWIRSAAALFSPEERAAVESAVREAELMTSAEIVPVVTSASSRYHRAQDIAGIWLAFLLLVALAVFSPEHQIDGIEAVAAFALGLGAGTFAAGMFLPLKRLFLWRADLEEAVMDGAIRAFRTFGVGETSGRTGVLIYVSLFERSAVVLGDVALARVLGPTDYAAVRDLLIDGMRRGQPEAAFVAAIRKTGVILAERLPRNPDDQPEITDNLRLLD